MGGEVDTSRSPGDYPNIGTRYTPGNPQRLSKPISVRSSRTYETDPPRGVRRELPEDEEDRGRLLEIR
jgi:hypothetical protein